MEGMGTFELAGVGGDAIMRTAVHTRRIVDPLWGAKTTGTAGPRELRRARRRRRGAGPAASSDAPNPFLGDRKDFYIARGQYSLGRRQLRGRASSPTPSSAAATTAWRARTSRCALAASRPRARPSWPRSTEAPDGRERRTGSAGRRTTRSRPSGRLHHPGRALRPRLPDGHRVPEPGRHHAGLGFLAPSFYPDAEEDTRGSSASSPFAFDRLRQGPHPGRQHLDRRARRAHALHAARASSASTTCSGEEPWLGQTFRDHQHPRHRPRPRSRAGSTSTPAPTFGRVDLLRPVTPTSGRQRTHHLRDQLPAERAASTRRSPTTAWSSTGARRRARLHRERPQHQDHVPARPPLLVRAIVQYDSSRQPRPHRPAGLVGAAAGHGRLRGLRLAHRAAGVGRHRCRRPASARGRRAAAACS